jgi:hypothetical protein
MLFFTYFHIVDTDVPDFRPDFDDEEAGEYGSRDWYRLYLFPGKTTTSAMSYDSESSPFIYLPFFILILLMHRPS